VREEVSVIVDRQRRVLAVGAVLVILVTWVWLGLMALTCVTTWGLSKDLFSPAVAAIGIFLIAAVKVRYVILDFMEFKDAPIPASSRLGRSWWRR
jgi:hypothetical protein